MYFALQFEHTHCGIHRCVVSRRTDSCLCAAGYVVETDNLGRSLQRQSRKSTQRNSILEFRYSKDNVPSCVSGVLKYLQDGKALAWGHQLFKAFRSRAAFQREGIRGKQRGRPSIKRGLGWEYLGCMEQQPRSEKTRTNKLQRDTYERDSVKVKYFILAGGSRLHS